MNAREGALEILKAHIPIEPNEVTEKELDRVTAILKEYATSCIERYDKVRIKDQHLC